MVAPVGSDAPSSVLEVLEQSGFDIAVLPRRDAPTIRNEVYYGDDGSRRWVLLTSPELFHELSVVPEDLPAWASGAECVLISAMSLASQEQCVRFFRERSTSRIALDLQEDYIGGNEQRILQLLSLVDVFLPSEEEVRRLTGGGNLIEILRWFASLGPRLVGVKLAERGSLLYEHGRGKLVHVPARRTEVVDPTGAGDAYCGGFLAAYLQDETDLERAGRAGAISAAFAVSGYGVEGLVGATRAEASRQLHDPTGWLSANLQLA
jgi:ribokinase